MKIIDIHTQKETTEDSRYKNKIENFLVKEYVIKNIDFPITHEYWVAIDTSFAGIWNNKIGIGGYFYWDEFSKEIFSELQSQKLLIEFERVDKIVTLMLTYIQDNGGFLE